MPIPEHRIDYTNLAAEILEATKYKGYKFQAGRNLDSWLHYSWAMLFKRKMTDYDIDALKRFLDKRFWTEVKQKSGHKLNYDDKYHLNQYIGKDGYIYMNKMMTRLDIQNPKETARLEKLLKTAKQERKARFLEYEKRCLKEMAQEAYIKNMFYLTPDGKIRKRK